MKYFDVAGDDTQKVANPFAELMGQSGFYDQAAIYTGCYDRDISHEIVSRNLEETFEMKVPLRPKVSSSKFFYPPTAAGRISSKRELTGIIAVPLDKGAKIVCFGISSHTDCGARMTNVRPHWSNTLVNFVEVYLRAEKRRSLLPEQRPVLFHFDVKKEDASVYDVRIYPVSVWEEIALRVPSEPVPAMDYRIPHPGFSGVQRLTIATN